MHATTSRNGSSSWSRWSDCQLSPSLRSESGAPIWRSIRKSESLIGPERSGLSSALSRARLEGVGAGETSADQSSTAQSRAPQVRLAKLRCGEVALGEVQTA